jgi:hypothetical protein
MGPWASCTSHTETRAFSGLGLSSAGDTRAQAVDLCGVAFDTRCLSFKLGPFGIAAPRPVPGRLVVPLSGAVVFGRGLGV